MLVGEKIFMTVVEEMSISKAATRSFVTQQCVSDHIKRLEEEHQVELFVRRPRLSLTPAGKVLYKTLCEIKELEEQLSKNLEKVKGGSKKKITIGVNGTRINMILSNLLTRYNSYYPEVVISFVIEDTRELEQMLLKEQIDMLLDLNTQVSPQLNTFLIGEDKLYFLISKTMYNKYFNDKDIRDFEEGIETKDFKNIPLVSNAESSTIHEILTYYAQRDEVELNVLYYTGDYETQIALCNSNLAAVVCPTTVIKRVMEYNRKNKDNTLYLFPLKNQTEKLKIQLVTNKEAVQEDYIKKFVEILQDILKKEYN